VKTRPTKDVSRKARKGAKAQRKPALLPFVFAFGLGGFGFFPAVRSNGRLLAAFLVASAVLCLWNLVLLLSGRVLTLGVSLKKQHYMQACVQVSVLLYWGWYWPQVYASVYLIAAQLLFAYAFDMLLGWSRRDEYWFGFAPFPVIFSINLFLLFRPDYFWLQFAMVAVGMTAKETIRWERDGRRVHIFNPSSFPLAVFSLALLATGTTDITWGKEIASTQFYPPHMYLMLFLIALPGQFLFGVTSMTMSAVLATWAFGRSYFAVTGIYFFYDSYIPIAVFLGMELLFTDPSTSPRTELGRIIYGVLYGFSTCVLYELLGLAGMPMFYDKLLQVPLLNLSVRGIDRVARSKVLRGLDPGAMGRLLSPRVRSLAYLSVWVVVFAGLSATQGLGDDHPGQWLPFWRQACQDGKAYACPYLADLETGFCGRGSAWACNDAGLMDIALARSGEDSRRSSAAGAAEPFRKACEMGFSVGCRNLQVLRSGAGEFAAGPPGVADFPIILRGSKGEVTEREPGALYALACREGWRTACGRETAKSLSAVNGRE